MTFGFDDILAGDAGAFLDAFGENVPAVYLPGAGGSTPGAPRPIVVIIERGAPMMIEKGQKGATVPIIIRVANNSVTGISSTEFDAGVDQITIAVNFGNSPVTRNFSQDKMRQDAGMMTLKIL